MLVLNLVAASHQKYAIKTVADVNHQHIAVPQILLTLIVQISSSYVHSV